MSQLGVHIVAKQQQAYGRHTFIQVYNLIRDSFGCNAFNNKQYTNVLARYIGAEAERERKRKSERK